MAKHTNATRFLKYVWSFFNITYERVNKIIRKFCSYMAHVSSGENGFRKSAKLCDGMKKNIHEKI